MKYTRDISGTNMENLVLMYNKDSLCRGDYIFFTAGLYKGRYGTFVNWNNDDKSQIKAYLEDGRTTFQYTRSIIKINNNLELEDGICDGIKKEIKDELGVLKVNIKERKGRTNFSLYPLLPEEPSVC